MNAYRERQSSGISWPGCPTQLLGEPVQPVPPLWPLLQRPAATFEGFEKQMVGSTAQEESVLNQVRKHYVLPADESVSTFLTEHRIVPQILLDAVPHLTACFGADIVFSLRAPIDEAGSRTLYAVAMWPGKSQEVRHALSKFDNDWWIARAGQAAGYLTFTYELV